MSVLAEHALLRDHEAERHLLASLLLSPGAIPHLLNDSRLRPDHFAVGSHGEAFKALVAISDRDERPDVVTLTGELADSPNVNDARQLADDIASLVPDSPPSAYARRVRDLHRRRELKMASMLLSDAADLGDAGKLAEAERILTAPAEAEPSTWSGLELAERFEARMDDAVVEAFSWPFERLDKWTGGGLRRKQVVLIGGWTSNGKSVVYDQILDHLALQGLRCHSYINEMSEQERMDRTMARLANVKFDRIRTRCLTPDEDVAIRRALSRVQVGLTECAGWSAQEIARHIRWNRWDVAGVDIVHEIEHHDERDLAEVARLLRTTAKSVDCVLVVCVHLNDQRVTSPQRPIPVLRDVRGTGMLTRGADVVLFIHRDDDEEGMPKDTGVLFAAKIRNGQPNVMGVVFQPERMRFVPVSQPTTEGQSA